MNRIKLLDNQSKQRKKRMQVVTRRNHVINILRTAPSNGLTISYIYERLCALGCTADRKTIERDITENIEGIKEAGREGNAITYGIEPSFANNLHIQLSLENLQVLAIALNAFKTQAPSYLDDRAQDAILTILNNLPESLKKQFTDFYSTSMGLSALPGKAVLPTDEHLKNILAALRGEKELKVIYDEKERTLGPINIEIAAGTPYLFAEENNQEIFKRFRISRFEHTEVTNKPYCSPDFEKIPQEKFSFGGFGGTVHEIKVIGGNNFADYFSSYEINSSQELTELEDNQWQLTLKSSLGHQLTRLFASLADDIQQIEPAELKDEVVRVLRTGAQNLG